MRIREIFAHLLCSAVLIISSGDALAQSFPSKPIRIVIPFPAGGSFDVLARRLGPLMSKGLGQSIIVDNRPGGGTVIGTELAARSPADGHTMLMVGSSFAIASALRSNLSYDILRDFTAVIQLGATPIAFAVHPSLPVKSLKDLVALAKSRPGELTYATPGVGVGQHIAGEMFKLAAGINIVHVPYQGAGPATTSVVGGHTTMVFALLPDIAPHVKAARLRALAVGSDERISEMKDIPTIAESGYPGFTATSWTGFVTNAGAPKEAVERLNIEANRALKAPEILEALNAQGWSAIGGSAERFGALIRSDAERFARVVREANIKVE